MRIRSLIWFTLSWILAPLGLLAGNLYTGSVFPSGSGYPLAEQVGAFGATVLIQPLTCLFCCIAGIRLQRSSLLRSMPIRRPLTIVFLHLISVPALASTAVLTLTMMSSSASRAASWSVDPRLFLAVLLESFAYATLGLAFGVTLNPLLGAPLAVVVPYVLIAFPPAASSYWMRHVTWISTGCCNIYDNLAARALISNLSFSIGLFAASLFVLLMGTRSSWTPKFATTAVSGAALVLAVTAALPLGVSPVDARTGSQDCRPSGRVTLCLWPEHTAGRAKADRILVRVNSLAASSGISLPKTLTELAPERVRWPTSPIDVSPQTADLTSSIATSLYPNTQCHKVQITDTQIASAESLDTPHVIVTLWWQHHLGIDQTGGSTDQEALAEFTSLMRLSQDEQVKKLNAMIATAQAVCTVQDRQ